MARKYKYLMEGISIKSVIEGISISSVASLIGEGAIGKLPP